MAVPMEEFVVRPGAPLSGSVRLSGAKNSALKLMAGCLLAEGRHVLREVPEIADVATMAELLGAMGARIERDHSGALIVEVPAHLTPVAPYELVERMRASIVVLGPLLARYGSARVSLPGGDDFGHRPIDFHLSALEAMGAEFVTEHGYLDGKAARLKGARIVLEFPSHTTTDNILMAAVLAKGRTIIENAAREPEVADLASFLQAMGAKVEGAGTSRIEVQGVEMLTPGEHTTIPDRVEAATFLAAVGIAGGEVTVEGARVDHMDMLVEKLTDMGLELSPSGSGILARSDGRLRSVDVATLPYPGVATDYKPLIVAMLTIASGVGIVSENLFRGRFRYVDELRRMGADIMTVGHHAVVRGVERLSGARVQATDLRAGAALVLAGLAAEGETLVSGAGHVDRGYEDFAGKLASIGADVTRRAQTDEDAAP